MTSQVTERIPNVESVFNYGDSTSLAAAIMMITNGLFGVACNSFVIYIFCKEKNEKTSFNVICMVRAVVNLFTIITNHLMIFVPTTLIGTSFISNTLETLMISISNSLYVANELSTVLIGVNRLVAIFFPMCYEKLCGMKPTIGILVFIYAYRIIRVTVEVVKLTANNCYSTYSVVSLLWVPDYSLNCLAIVDNGSIVLGMIVTFLVVLVVNMATFTKICMFYKNRNKEDTESYKRIKKNVYLFIQTSIQDSLYVIDVSCTFYFVSLYDNRFYTFICGTFVWESLHSLDGFIMILFKERLPCFQRQLFKHSPSKIVTIQVS